MTRPPAGTSRPGGAGWRRRVKEPLFIESEPPPLVSCPHCGSTVPAGEFCGHCGAHLPSGSARRQHAFAAVPSQGVAYLSIVTTLFPHLPHRGGRPFRLALISAGVVGLLLAALHLYAMAAGGAGVALPGLYLT